MGGVEGDRQGGRLCLRLTEKNEEEDQAQSKNVGVHPVFVGGISVTL